MEKRPSTNNIGEEAYNRRIHKTVGLQGGNAMDLRIEKTEKGIRNAFIELRSRKPLEKITIKELCEHAYKMCIRDRFIYLSLILGAAGALVILAAAPIANATLALSPDAKGYLTFMFFVMSYFCLLYTSM